MSRHSSKDVSSHLRKCFATRESLTATKLILETVSIGSTLVVEDLEFGDTMEYTIVGTAESDPLKNKISNESPVGKAISARRKARLLKSTFLQA